MLRSRRPADSERECETAATLAQRAGRPELARRQLERVPFEPIGLTDLPETLVPRAELVEALIAAAHGELAGALLSLSSAEAAWRRMLHAGQVEPAVELGRVLAERATLLARSGREDDARAAEDEAARLADTLRFDGYLAALRSLPLPSFPCTSRPPAKPLESSSGVWRPATSTPGRWNPTPTAAVFGYASK